MKVAYVTAYDVSNVRKVNGAGQYIAECLRDQSISLEHINVQHAPAVYLARALLKAGELLHRRLHATTYVSTRSRLLARVYARQVEARLRTSDADLIFSPICPGSLPTSYVKSQLPIVIWTDATFAGLLNFYPGFTNLAPRTIADGLANERAALERCRLAIFSSEWAARTAVEHHGMARANIAVVPFGPYMRDLPDLADVRRLVEARSTSRCRLLFMGRDWHRKGGDIALETVRELRARGVEAELTIAGGTPTTDAPLPDYVRALGFLSKADQQGRQTIRRLYAESHFLLIPSRADCAPAAVREASAYGVPSVASDVGGLDTLVRDGSNGQVFPTGTAATAYADYIAGVFGDAARYRRLALASFAEYEARLSWASAGRSVKELLSEVISERAAPPVPVH